MSPPHLGPAEGSGPGLAQASGPDAGRAPGVGTSRAATNRLLREVAAGGFGPRVWPRFLGAAGARSLSQVSAHRLAAVEVTALHALFLVAAGRRDATRVVWVGSSWAMSVLHLGMLESRRGLGVANTVCLVRANLPASGSRLGGWRPLVAALSDLADGRLARATGTTTPFGRYADPLADLVFWTWWAFGEEGRARPTRPGHQAKTAARGAERLATRACVAAVWWAPTLVVTVRSFAGGGMVEAPRPRLLRPAAALQVLLTVRSLRRLRSSALVRLLNAGVSVEASSPSRRQGGAGLEERAPR